MPSKSILAFLKVFWGLKLNKNYVTRKIIFVKTVEKIQLSLLRRLYIKINWHPVNYIETENKINSVT